ncbi:MAG: hypothetical protein WAU32_07505 [Thermoanaerobaculia bacterium]
MGLAWVSHSSRTGSRAGPVRLFCLLPLVLLASPPNVAGSRHRVLDSILGIHVGSSLADARARLEPHAVQQAREPEEEERSERGEGRTKAWTLKDSEYGSVALNVNDAEKVVWITGFVRPGREIPFSRLGDLSVAARATDSMAVWNVATQSGGYRLVAKGEKGRARVVSLLSLASPSPE